MTRMKTVVTRIIDRTTELKRPPHPQGDSAVPAELTGGEDVFHKPERVQEWLRAWPAWQLGGNGKTIHRVRTFPAHEVAAQYGAFVTGLAGVLALPVKVDVCEGEVALSLYSGRRRGRRNPLTETVLGFATQLG